MACQDFVAVDQRSILEWHAHTHRNQGRADIDIRRDFESASFYGRDADVPMLVPVADPASASRPTLNPPLAWAALRAASNR